MEAGDYDAWSCLNEAYQVQEVDVRVRSSGTSHSASLVFPGIVATEVFAEDYAVLPGVRDVHYVGGSGTDGSQFCVVREANRMHYVIAIGSGDCPSGCLHREFHYVRTDAPGHVAVTDSWDGDVGRDPADGPCWLDVCDPYDPYGLR